MLEGFRLFRVALALGLGLLVPLSGAVGCSAGSASVISGSRAPA